MGTSIDDAISRLFKVTKRSVLPRVRKGGNKRILAAIADEIRPLHLPNDLLTFWRRVDVASVAATPFPGLETAELALAAWQQHHSEHPGMSPRLLFPFAYERHSFLFVELDGPAGDGGAVYEWGSADDDFHLVHASVASYVAQLATMIELEEFVVHHADGSSWVEFDPDRQWEGARAVRLASELQASGRTWERVVPGDAALWPARWLTSDGVTEQDLIPQGATSTVAALLALAAAGKPAEGTIRGTVTWLGGSAGDVRVTVDDGTGELDIWCPAKVCRFGPTIRVNFEFDVVVRAATAPPDPRSEHHEIQRLALSGDLDPVTLQDAAMAFHRKAFGAPAAAEATAIRPLS
jgi:hypothetical protein